MIQEIQRAGECAIPEEEQRAGDVNLDVVLIQQVREIADGANIHQAENLIGAYTSSVRHYRVTGDPGFLRLASESDRELRVFLVKGRLRRFVGNIWRDHHSAA